MPRPKPKPRQRKSNDPANEALRKHKRDWSDMVSLYISNLIDFKRGLNGRGSSELGISPSSIKEPLPPETGSVLAQLAAEFQQLVSGANSIISEQASYSQRRRKKQPKQPKVQPTSAPQQQEAGLEQTPSPSQDQVVQQLSQLAFEQYLIKKEGTSRLSRFWQYFKSMLPSNEPFRKERIGLLSTAASLFYAVLDFENDVLILDVEKIPEADAKYSSLHYHLNIFSETLRQHLDLLTQQKQDGKDDQEGSIGGDTSEQNDQQLIKDLEGMAHKIMNNQLAAPAELKRFHDLINAFKNEEDPFYKDERRTSLIKYWENLLKSLKAEKGADKVSKALGGKFSQETQTLIKFAHNPITRFLRRQLVKALKINKTALPRLKIVENLDKIKTALKLIMGSLEKEIDTALLIKQFQTIEKEFANIKIPLNILNTFSRDRFYSDFRKKNKGKPDDPLQDWLLKRKLRQDLRQDMF